MLEGDCLDQAIGSDGFGAQAGGQPVDALAVNRVDLKHRRQVQGFEHAARLHLDRVSLCVLHGQVRVIGFAVIEKAR
ncbi:hypothetical protein D3C75_1365240 [compost metagenome]